MNEWIHSLINLWPAYSTFVLSTDEAHLHFCVCTRQKSARYSIYLTLKNACRTKTKTWVVNVVQTMIRKRNWKGLNSFDWLLISSFLSFVKHKKDKLTHAKKTLENWANSAKFKICKVPKNLSKWNSESKKLTFRIWKNWGRNYTLRH